MSHFVSDISIFLSTISFKNVLYFSSCCTLSFKFWSCLDWVVLQKSFCATTQHKYEWVVDFGCMFSAICWWTVLRLPSLPSSSLPYSLSPATVSLPATIVTSSLPTSVTGHMMYPSPHTVMYASTPTLTDGGLAVLNAFSQGTSAMQVSHVQSQDTGEIRAEKKIYWQMWINMQCVHHFK